MLAAALAAVALAACDDERPAAASGATEPAADAPHLAVLAPLSGPRAALGASALAAVRAVVDAAADGGPPPLVVDGIDTAARGCTSAGAEAAAEPRTAAVVAGPDGACVTAIAAATAPAGLALLAADAGGAPAPDAGLLRLTPTAADEAVASVRLAADLGASRVAVLEDGSAEAVALADAALAAAPAADVAVVERLRVDATDAAATLRRVSAGADAVILLAAPDPVGLAALAGRAEEGGAGAAAVPVIVPDAYAIAGLLDLPAPALEGVRVLFPGVAPDVLRDRGGGASALADALAAEDASLEPLAAEAAAAAQVVLATLDETDGSRAAVRAAAGGVRLDAGTAATGAAVGFAPDGSAAVRTLSVLVARPPRLGVERTLVLP